MDLARIAGSLLHLAASVGFQLGAMLVSAVFHEVAHGWAAFRLGDTSARDAGRLTLNPLAHINLVTTIIVPVALLLAGLPPLIIFKPVPVDVRNMANPRMGSLLVSLAGPGANIALALAASLVYRLLAPGSVPVTVQAMVAFFVLINLVFAAFNLLPFPPLDGSHIFEAFLPYPVLRFFYRIRTYVLIGFLIVVFTPLFRYIWGPLSGFLYHVQVLMTGIHVRIF